MPAIVTVNTSVTSAPSPSKLQGTGAAISQGATNTTPGTLTFLSSVASLTPILNGAQAVSTLTKSGQTVTVTTTNPHGFTIGDSLYLTIAGSIPLTGPNNVNGSFLCTITGTSTFTYITKSSNTSFTGTITYTVEDVAELLSMATTFFSQSGNIGFYVLELGPGNPSDGVSFLTTWINNNPGQIYSYIVPRTWDNVPAYLALLAQFEAPNAQTYFFTTTTLATYQSYAATLKSAVLLIESPAYGVWPINAITAISTSGTVVTVTTTSNHGISPGQWFQLSGNVPTGYNGWFQAQPNTNGTSLVFFTTTTLASATTLGTVLASQYSNPGIATNEFSLAAPWFVTLNYNPTTSNKVPPLNNAFVYDVTPFPTQGNGSLLSTLYASSVNYISTGAEGGISTATFVNGITADMNQFGFWYAVDWVTINLNRNISNAVINGSNNSNNPLYYNQQGINSLQAVGASTLSSGISYGLVFGSLLQTELTATDFAANVAAGKYNGYAVINAVPLTSYAAINPSAYRQGLYGGFQVVFAPQNGFSQIVINLNATQFV